MPTPSFFFSGAKTVIANAVVTGASAIIGRSIFQFKSELDPLRLGIVTALGAALVSIPALLLSTEDQDSSPKLPTYILLELISSAIGSGLAHYSCLNSEYYKPDLKSDVASTAIGAVALLTTTML